MSLALDGAGLEDAAPVDKAHPYHPDPPAPPPDAVPEIGARVDPARHPGPEESKALLKAMLLSRRVERRIVELYRQGQISGGCYTGIGNEATSVGSAFAMVDGDVLVPTQRDMGSHLVRGHTALDVMQQYLKRGTSQTGGKDGGLHLGKEGSDIVGMVSHLGHMMPVAVGVAMAERLKGNHAAVLTTIGDGATSLGDFHEALNFAAVQKAAVVFLIVNNQYAYSTPITSQYACARLADRAVGYGMPGFQVDGTDVVEVLDATRIAFERGRRGEGPTLLECLTMRMRGHSEHDDFKYVPQALLQRWGEWDPLVRFETWATRTGRLSVDIIKALHREVDHEVEAAIEAASRDPDPDPTTATDGVFRYWDPAWTVPDGVDAEVAGE